MFLFYFPFFRFYSLSTRYQGTEGEERARVWYEAIATWQPSFLCFSLGSCLEQGCVLVTGISKSFHLISGIKKNPSDTLSKMLKTPGNSLCFGLNILLGKAIPCPHAKGWLFAQVSGLGGKIQAQAEWFFFRELESKCGEGPPVFHCRWHLCDRLYYLLGSSIESRLHFVSLTPAG